MFENRWVEGVFVGLLNVGKSFVLRESSEGCVHIRAMATPATEERYEVVVSGNESKFGAIQLLVHVEDIQAELELRAAVLTNAY